MCNWMVLDDSLRPLDATVTLVMNTSLQHDGGCAYSASLTALILTSCCFQFPLGILKYFHIIFTVKPCPCGPDHDIL